MDNVITTAGYLRSERMDIDILIDTDLVSLDYVLTVVCVCCCAMLCLLLRAKGYMYSMMLYVNMCI